MTRLRRWESARPVNQHEEQRERVTPSQVSAASQFSRAVRSPAAAKGCALRWLLVIRGAQFGGGGSQRAEQAVGVAINAGGEEKGGGVGRVGLVSACGWSRAVNSLGLPSVFLAGLERGLSIGLRDRASSGMQRGTLRRSRRRRLQARAQTTRARGDRSGRWGNR
jgi:hypothetical protein